MGQDERGTLSVMIDVSSFADILTLLQIDPQTRVIVLIGEIRRTKQEITAVNLHVKVSAPVVAFIVRKNLHKNRRMGHVGAVVSLNGESSTARKKNVYPTVDK